MNKLVTMLNPGQWKSLLAWALAFAGGTIVGSGKMTSAEWGAVSNALMESIPVIAAGGIAIWRVFAHADSAVTIAASQVPGVKVVVDTAVAPDAVVAAAKDPANKDVVPK